MEWALIAFNDERFLDLEEGTANEVRKLMIDSQLSVELILTET